MLRAAERIEHRVLLAGFFGYSKKGGLSHGAFGDEAAKAHGIFCLSRTVCAD
jgi:hypothetical protein